MAHHEEGSEQPAPLQVQIVSLHFAPETTGNAPYVSGLARGLASRGMRVEVLAAVPHYPGWSVYPETEWSSSEGSPNLSIRRIRSYIPGKSSFARRLAYEVAYGMRLSQHLDRSADAIVLVSPGLFASTTVRLRLGKQQTRPPVIAWTQDLYSAGLAETPGTAARVFGKLISAIEGLFLRSCDATVVIHQRFQRYVCEQLKAHPEDTHVVRNWSHVRQPDAARSGAARERMGWSTRSEIVVLHAGNMGEKQGLDNVVAAARWAEANSRPVRFVLMGGGNQKAALEQLGDGCSQLEFREPVADEEFSDVLGAADVLLVNERPTLREAAVPSKLTSYFATGRPVLAATNNSSITAEEIAGSGAGWVIPPDDPSGLVAAAEEISAGWSDADAANGPAYVTSMLSEAAALDSFSKLLHAVADHRL